MQESILSKLGNYSTSPNKNSMVIDQIGDYSVYLYFYLAFFTLLFIVLVLRKIALRNSPEIVFNRSNFYLTAFVIFFLTLTGLQTAGNIRQFIKEYKEISPMSTGERISLYFKNSYAYAQFCQQLLPGKHHCATDTDLMRESYQDLTYIAVAYYLYPIDIRLDIANDPNCLAVFVKENPENSVPEDFQILDTFDHLSLLAVKKDRKL